MDILDGKVFLGVGEQEQTGLESPIELSGFPVAERLAGLTEEVQRLEAVVYSDPEDYLPTEKGEARPALAQAYARRRLYTGIANHLMFSGTVDAAKLIPKIK